MLKLPNDWIDLPDGDLGEVILDLFIAAQAEDLGIPPSNIPEAFRVRVIEYVLGLETSSARLVPLEKVLHKAAQGDFDKAGNLLMSRDNWQRRTLANGKVHR